ncbi:MAG: gliding motility-associated C-terminal domain-containing protein [Ruminococcus flavefaciens]|nr:gliding motility-associated C-terminal domain-containing protein [Ruminococcus flavefaciens]
MFSLLSAQPESVYRAWGKAIGKAQTDRDFLIYDASCFDNKLFIVGKAEDGTSFELKRGENSYFHEKDEYTDAFLACYSLEGELQWSTYLPTLEEGYYNAFATTIHCRKDNTIIVIGNTYQIQGSIGRTKDLVPYTPGRLFFFEFNLNGSLRNSNSFEIQSDVDPAPLKNYPPKVTSIVDSVLVEEDPPVFSSLLGGFTIGDYFQTTVNKNPQYVYSHPFFAFFPQQNDPFIEYSYFLFYSWGDDRYVSTIDMLTPNGWGFVEQKKYGEKDVLFLGYLMPNTSKEIPQDNAAKESDTTYDMYLCAKGIDRLTDVQIMEGWNIATSAYPNHDDFEYYGAPLATFNINAINLFPGTVQNIHAYKGKFLVQGIHCSNYYNGFFSKEGQPYAYSHDKSHTIPKYSNSFYQSRNYNHTTVPYLLLYDSATFFGTPPMPVPGEDKTAKDYVGYDSPCWGSYLNADWYYEDIFHVTDSGHKKDIYQPYEPILCSYGDKFFLIGNVRNIDLYLIDNPTILEVNHHQGVILAFNVGCPAEQTAFQDVRFLCPDDSVELKLAPEYAGFRFRFEEDWFNNGSIVLNADSTHAWVKKEGLYHAILDGSALGCPDARTDTVQISLSLYPEPVPGMPDTAVSCAALEIPLQAASNPDTTFSYLWYDGDTAGVKDVAFAGDSIFHATVDVNGYCTSFRDSTFVRFLPPYVNLGRDTALCYFRADTIADTAVLLKLYGRQGYFPDADWIFRWKVNGQDAGSRDSLWLSAADLRNAPNRQAEITVFVSLSDTDTEGCTAGDTLLVTLYSLPDFSPNRYLPQDSVLCAHLDLDLQLPVASNNYRCFWLDQDSVLLPYGNDTSRFTIQGMRGTDSFGAGTDTREPRFFQLKLEHKACDVSFFDTLLVYDQVKPVLELPFHDTVICLNEPVELDSLSPLVYRPFYGFEWNTGEKHPEYSFTDSGTYVLAFSVLKDFDFCGYKPATDTVHALWSDPALTLISIPEDTSFCKKLSITLDASVPFPSTRYSWQEGSLDDLFSPLEDSTRFTDPIFKVDKENTLALFVVDTMGCVNTRQVNVTEDDCKPQLSIPNVFTPNGDGINDVLKFKQIEKCFDVDILIVDRKGSHVLHEKVRNADDFSWNGCYKNGSKKLPDGPYFYLVSYKDAYGKKKVQSGSITILGTAE